MKSSRINFLTLLSFLTLTSVTAYGGTILFQAENAQLNTNRVEQIKNGIALKTECMANVDAPETKPDFVFNAKSGKSGRYVFQTHASVDENTAKIMRHSHRKQDSLFLKIAIGDARPVKRAVFVPWSSPESCKQTLGRFDINQDDKIKIWLPKGVCLDWLKLVPYVPPTVPEAAQNYKPPIIPPPSHPRLWVTAKSLPQIRSNLTQGVHAALWNTVQEEAAKPYDFSVDPDTAITFQPALEKAAVEKAFVYLMTREKPRAREAIELLTAYLPTVHFGNLLDTTRNLGRTIYAASQVYDWCYDQMLPSERELIRQQLMRLAPDMEIGWPPFKEPIVIGHGDEAQLNRNLLSMAIAIYDEDPVPYKYCAYRILEELVPMKRFEYQSPRHSQGSNYGPYRFGWDMHAAMLFYRMSGVRIFDDSIKEVPYAWLYMRTPDGNVLKDGDGVRTDLGPAGLICAAYYNDPIIKGDIERNPPVWSSYDAVHTLLLNDPNLKAADGLDSLPLTRDSGPIIGSMIARTGWNMGRAGADDVVVEMKGGGYQFGNHQHEDAGSFQIYYRGFQAVDLGQYAFYGTPYDMGFNKRSVAHSMMLVFDPKESLKKSDVNDGGTRFVRSSPLSPEQAKENPVFKNGKVISSSFGPDQQRPVYSYFSVDLTSAYSDKIEKYVRRFCFLNLENKKIPALLIIADHITTANPAFKKYWQINTLNPPKTTADGVILQSSAMGLSGKVNVQMLIPSSKNRTLQILSGKDAYNVFGHVLEPPRPDAPEANGHRILFSPKNPKKEDQFLTVLTLSDEQAPNLPVDWTERETYYILSFADRVVVLNKTYQMLHEPLKVKISGSGNQQLILTGLAPGKWSVANQSGEKSATADVKPAKNTAFFILSAGTYTVTPENN